MSGGLLGKEWVWGLWSEAVSIVDKSYYDPDLELTEEENCKKYIFSNAIDENCEDLNVSRRGMN
jgi:hypothetical protein